MHYDGNNLMNIKKGLLSTNCPEKIAAHGGVIEVLGCNLKQRVHIGLRRAGQPPK